MRPHQLARARRHLTTIAVLAGCAVAMAAGGASLWIGLVAAVLSLAGRLDPKPPGPTALVRWRAASWITAGGLVAAGVLGASLLLLALVLVGWLQVHRAWVGKRALDDRLALLLALLQLLVGCILTVSPILAPLFVIYVCTATPALLLCYLGIVEEGEVRTARPDAGSRTRVALAMAATGPAVLALALVIFLAFPRVEASNILGSTASGSVSGFGGNVELGDVGSIKDNPTIALRLAVTDGTGAEVSPPFYVAGAALDHFDGRAWTSTVGGSTRISPRGTADADPKAVRLQEVMVEPLGEDVLFAIPDLEEVRGLDGLVSRDANGVWHLSGANRRLSYRARSVVRAERDLGAFAPDPLRHARSQAERSAARSGAWLQLPGDLDPRVRALAIEIAGRAGPGASAWQQALAIRDWLRSDFAYTVVPDDAGIRQPLAAFLFERRSGHCEYFSTALTVLLRAIGIPARVVNGFYGGEWNQYGRYYVFRQSDAHSWTQANFGEAGWITMDGTPATPTIQARTSSVKKMVDVLVADWYEVVLDYDLETQLSWVERIRRAVPEVQPGRRGLGGSIPLLASLVALLGALVGFRLLLSWLAGERQTRRRPTGRIARIHERTRRLVARRGWSIPPSLPPLEAARWLVEHAGPAAAPLEELAWALYRVRYAGESEDGLVEVASAAASRLSELPKHRVAA
jgi:protein-glutamine gamma-glutamyltransferase